jgi:branched-chain amino acid transport system substrate-binding protein
MRLRALGVALIACAVIGTTVVASGSSASQNRSPIVIGAVVDLSNTMKYFDGPALNAAQLEVARINAHGGVDHRMLKMIVENDQLNPTATRSDALDVISKGANILWVTCDVQWATPSTLVGLSDKLLTVAPCIGTDQMGPKRFGALGKLAFSYGNVAQDEGAAMAQLAWKNGWRTADTVTDQSIVYTVNLCQAFTSRFTQLGGRIVHADQFTQGDHTITSVASRINGAPAKAIALCTYASPAGDLPAFVSSLRGLGNNTAIVGPWAIDGSFWLPQDPKVSNNLWWVTYASVFGDDPSAAVRRLEAQLTAKGEAPATGGFITGASAIDGIAAAIRQAGGSTNGAKLAKLMQAFRGLPTISGPISFSARWHSVYGREYRVIEVKNGKPTFRYLLKATSPAPL